MNVIEKAIDAYEIQESKMAKGGYNMRKFTKGPWAVDDGLVISASHGRLSIAEAHDHSETSADHTEEEAQANARLIAEAPAMYQALKALFDNCAMIHKFGGDVCNRKQANETIASAKAIISRIDGE